MKQRIKKAVCLLLAGLTLVLAGCVKTPEGMAVAAKTKIDGFHLGEVLNEDGTPKAQELGEPKHITESWTQALGGSADGGGTEQRLDYTIKIDADVTVPEDGIFPVYGVAKAKYMDEDVFDRFVNVLFEGCEGKYSAPTGSQYKKGCFDSDEWAAMNSVKVWEKLRAMGISAELHTLALREHCFQRYASPGTGSYTMLDRIKEFYSFILRRRSRSSPSLSAMKRARRMHLSSRRIFWQRWVFRTA